MEFTLSCELQHEREGERRSQNAFMESISRWRTDTADKSCREHGRFHLPASSTNCGGTVKGVPLLQREIEQKWLITAGFCLLS